MAEGPDPFANYEMKAPKYVAPPRPDPVVIEQITDSELESLTKEQLSALLKLCDARKIRYALLTKEEKREQIKLKVYSIAMESTNDSVTLKAANDWLDREDGRPAQSINAAITHMTLADLVEASYKLVGASDSSPT